MPVEKFDVNESDPTEWIALDTIFYIVIVGLAIFTLAILIVILYKLVCRKISERTNV